MWISDADRPEPLGLAPPGLLEWKVTEPFKASINQARTEYEVAASGLQIKILKFIHFGKGTVKRMKMSPDAFVQQAIQLAHYRLHNEMVRMRLALHLRHGRAWDFTADAMPDPSAHNATSPRRTFVRRRR